jgi:hypothetical protein
MTKSVHGIMDDSAIALFNNTENTIFYGFLSFAGIIPIHNFGHVSQSQYEWKVFFFTVFLDRAYGSGPLGRRYAMARAKDEFIPIKNSDRGKILTD